MRSTRIHTKQSQPTQWSFCLGMFARIGGLFDSNPGTHKPERMGESLDKEAGR
jgi:hypothetical protein